MPRLQSLAVVIALAACGSSGHPPEPGGGTAPPPRPETAPSSEADARHLLSRMTFGPRPQDVEAAVAMGPRAWLDAQLAPPEGPDASEAIARERFPYAFASGLELRAMRMPEEQQEEDGEPAEAMMADDRAARRRPIPNRELIGHVQLATVTRHVLSERQVEEVMVDFWTNHFNVLANKRGVGPVLADYVENVIRRHALGRFEDLLVAVARHPAMLLYLDNAVSTAERPAPDGTTHGGINENYARELLELHTIGVDGGYTQRDVREVARILSGWGAMEFGFAYVETRHDAGEKVVMGRTFEAGGSIEEGLTLLRWLAGHEATARFLSTKLVRRFVSDEPDPALVDAVAAALRESSGDIRAALRAMVGHPRFWAPEHRGGLVKTPLEFVTSALRGLGAPPDESLGLRRTLQALGQPPFGEPVPTGYPDTADRWLGAAAMAGRFRVAAQLGRRRLPGVRWQDAPRPGTLTELNRRLLGLPSDSPTLRAVERQTRESGPRGRDAIAVTMLLSSPEFQRQ